MAFPFGLSFGRVYPGITGIHFNHLGQTGEPSIRPVFITSPPARLRFTLAGATRVFTLLDEIVKSCDTFPMKTIQTQVFNYSELSDAAKAKARDWFREYDAGDTFGADCVIDNAKETFAICGISIDRVYYSGFWSQGDGACFEGTWRARDVKPGGIAAHMPADEELKRIASVFEEIAKEFPDASFSVEHSGYYYHEHYADFSFSFPDNDDGTDWPENKRDEYTKKCEQLEENAKDAMRWIYNALEEDYDWRNSDEQVAETIEANEYTFTAEGKQFG